MSISTSSPLGATEVNGGVNYSLFSRIATGVELLLFDKQDDPKPARVISMPVMEHTNHHWHTFVPKLKAG